MNHPKRMHFPLHALVVLTAALASACADASNPTQPSLAQAQGKAPAAHSAADVAKASPAGKVVIAYLDLHKSLAADDFTASQKRFAEVRKAADANTAISDAALRKQIQDSARTGAAAKDLDAAREAFAAMSRALIAWLRAEPNPSGESLRLANCPMAFDTGAKWLQSSDRVENPYYGASMFTCGSIDATVKAGEKLPPK